MCFPTRLDESLGTRCPSPPPAPPNNQPARGASADKARPPVDGSRHVLAASPGAIDPDGPPPPLCVAAGRLGSCVRRRIDRRSERGAPVNKARHTRRQWRATNGSRATGPLGAGRKTSVAA